MKFADGVDKIKEKTAEVTSAAVQKMEILKEIARTKRTALLFDKRIEELRAELADLCYSDHMLDETVDPDQYRDLCEKIFKARREKEKLEQRLKNLKTQLADREE